MSRVLTHIEELRELLERHSEKLIVLVFQSVVLDVCLDFSNRVNTLLLESRYSDRLYVISIDAEDFQNLIGDFGVKIFPTTIFVQRGLVKRKYEGGDFVIFQKLIDGFL